MTLFTSTLRLLPWLFLQPSAWRRLIQQIDPTLSSHFCLVELTGRQWCNPALLRLLLQIYLVYPGLLVLIILLVMATGGYNPMLWVGLLFTLLISLVYASLVGVAVSAAVLVVIGLTFIWAWAQPTVLTIDMITSTRFAFLFGWTNAVALHITNNLARRTEAPVLARQRDSLIPGLLLSVCVFALVATLSALIINGREGGVLQGQWTALVIAGMGSGLVALAAWWYARHWCSSMLIGGLLFVSAFVLFGATGADFGRDPSGQVFLTTTVLVVIMVFLVLFVLPYVLVARLAGVWLGVVAGTVSSLLVYPAIWFTISLYPLWLNLTISTALLLVGWWRPLLFYPFELVWNTLLLRLEERRNATQLTADAHRMRDPFLAWNAVFWDEPQYLPLYDLDTHLLLVIEQNPTAGETAMNLISASRQRWAAQAAQIELDARRLEHCHTVAQVAQMHNELGAGALVGPASALLRSFSKRSEDVAAGLAQSSIFNRRLVLRDVEESLDNLVRELTRSSDPYASRFRPIASQWQQIMAEQTADLARLLAVHHEIQNPYIVGVPLTRRQQIFVGRTDISARIESFLQDQHHPPLLLYGQRRMGKTSLLYNLRWMLPSRIAPLLVDLQGPVAQATDHTGLLYALAKGMTLSAQQQELVLPPLTRTSLAGDPFVVFDDWLDAVEQALIAGGRDTLLLALDEFEALDRAISEKRFGEEAVLGTLRHIIQHRPRFKLLLAGSHTLDEFQRWSSYLINAQMLHLRYLDEAAARQLIERPIDDFALSYASDASQSILDLTRGHPYLVQLVCSELVNRKNEQAPDQRLWATRADVEAVVPEVLIRGQQFFADIELNQVDEAGLAVLRFMARQKESKWCSGNILRCQFAQEIEVELTLALLCRRELIEEEDGKYRFQVDVIRRWFAQSKASGFQS